MTNARRPKRKLSWGPRPRSRVASRKFQLFIHSRTELPSLPPLPLPRPPPSLSKAPSFGRHISGVKMAAATSSLSQLSSFSSLHSAPLSFQFKQKPRRQADLCFESALSPADRHGRIGGRPKPRYSEEILALYAKGALVHCGSLSYPIPQCNVYTT